MAWGALGLQLLLSIETAISEGETIRQGVITYLGYFTILTNVAGALTLSVPAWAPGSVLGTFFRRSGPVTAITASLLLVGITYFFLLRDVWEPKGLHQLSAVMLHYVTPPLLLSYWWLFIPKQQLHWSDILPWSLYPIGYLIYILIRGRILQDYPYPFMDVSTLGYGQVLLNAVGLLLGFTALALLLIAVGRSLPR